jgi:hypothetical protein
MFHVAIGAWASAKQTSVKIVGSMVFATSVVKDTEQETMIHALLSSTLPTEHELLQSQCNVTRFVENGPHSLSSISNPSLLKCKALDTLETPRFHRGFVFSDKAMNNVTFSRVYRVCSTFAITSPTPDR